MMEMTQIERLNQWIAENPLEWYTICGQGYDNISAEVFWEIDEKVKTAGFPWLSLVLYTSHSYAVDDNAFRAMKRVLTEQPFSYNMQFRS